MVPWRHSTSTQPSAPPTSPIQRPCTFVTTCFSSVPSPSVPTERVPRHHLPAAPLGLVATASASDLAMDCPETRQPLADGWHPLQRSAEQQRTTIAAAAAPAGHPHTHERVPRHHLLATPLALAAAASASDPAMDCPETRRPVGDGLREQGRSAEQQRTTIVGSSNAGRPPGHTRACATSPPAGRVLNPDSRCCRP